MINCNVIINMLHHHVTYMKDQTSLNTESADNYKPAQVGKKNLETDHCVTDNNNNNNTLFVPLNT